MSLITTTNLKTLTDRYARIYHLLYPVFGDPDDADAPVAPSAQYAADLALDLLTTIGDHEQISDMEPASYTAFTKANLRSGCGFLTNVLNAIGNHCGSRGSSVNAGINSLETYLEYYNGGDGGDRFNAMVCPGFADLWYLLFRTRLPNEGVMSPAVHPDWDSAVAAAAMGSRAVGGAFTDGDDIDETIYSEVEPLVEITVNFAGGATDPVVAIAGVNQDGLTTTTWSVTLDSNNPASAVSTTITPSVAAQARQTVALGSTSGIVAGSVLKVNSGLVDEEVIVVETVGGGSITAVFTKAHSAGAALTGKRTYAMTPSVVGDRCRDVTGITITVGTHSAGTVRITGKQDRVPV